MSRERDIVFMRASFICAINQPVMQGACCFLPKSCQCERFDCCCFSREISARSQACSVLHLIASAVLKAVS